MGTNPPTTAERFWVIEHGAPWLDSLCPIPASRASAIGPEDQDVEAARPGNSREEFTGVGLADSDSRRTDRYIARSRTFIPAAGCRA